MNINALINDLRAAVLEYIADEENYTDNVQAQINIETGEVCIADPENEIPGCDYVPIMDLIKMSVDNPGQWLPDEDAIEQVAADYAVE